MAYQCAVCDDEIHPENRTRKETPVNVTLRVHESCKTPVEAALSEYRDRSPNRGIESQNPSGVTPGQIADTRQDLWTSIATEYGIDPTPQSP
jgi:hypothetical protein